ncbi:MAG: ATP-binding protein [Anaerolineae bacterium]|nr:ATP-binding protein [Anaerolineae bacterium]
MHDIDWHALKPLIDAGNEGAKIEFKEQLDLSSRTGKAEFVKDVTAIANTTGGDGQLVIGVMDARRRSPGSSITEWLTGFSVLDPDQLQGQMTQAIAHFVEPPFEIRYVQAFYPGLDISLGIIAVPTSQCRPHVIKNDGDRIYAGQIFVRRGSQIALASRQDIIDMCGDYYLRILEEERLALREFLENTEEDAVVYRLMARQVCQKLYRQYPKAVRDVRMRKLLEFFGHVELFQQWFKEI